MIANNLEMYQLKELSDAERSQISGGAIDPFSLGSFVVALCAFAYQYGKDAAERERRHAW